MRFAKPWSLPKVTQLVNRLARTSYQCIFNPKPIFLSLYHASSPIPSNIGQLIISKCLSSKMYSKDACDLDSNTWSIFRTVIYEKNLNFNTRNWIQRNHAILLKMTYIHRNYRQEKIQTRSQFYHNIKEINYILKNSKLVLDTGLI